MSAKAIYVFAQNQQNKHNTHILMVVHFTVKPRSKSASSSNRTTISTMVNETTRQQQTLHQPKGSSIVEQTTKRQSPKIDSGPIKVMATTTVINNSSHSHPPKKTTFDVQSNTPPSFNINKPPSGRHSYAVISTELHTNEM